MSHSVLIVDDDPTQRRLIEGVLEKNGFRSTPADGGQAALDYLADNAEKTDIVLLDLNMPGMTGLEVLEALRPLEYGIPVIVLTGQAGVETVVTAMRAGAVDFVVKPASPERLTVSVQNALQMRQLSGEVSRLKRKQSGVLTFSDVISSSAPMQQVVRLGERAAQSRIPILIEGESGSGKEVIARAIQGSSDRAGRPFITVNCGAIPENLVESILFGHEKGSFTGAASKHAGKFVEADGGTLFLDEIGELPLDMQVKLLRVLQENEVDPIGSKKPTKIDIRLISATNRDLLEMAQTGEFREDLYYRLNVFPIWIPPLRDRLEELPELLEFFVGRLASEEGKRIRGIDPVVIEMLLKYSWPGNIRQLENAVFRAIVMCDGDVIKPEDFPQIAALTDTDISVQEQPLALQSGATPVDATGIIPLGDQEDYLGGHEVGGHSGSQSSADLAESLRNEIASFDAKGHMRRLEDVEGDMIRQAIDHYSGQMSEVARRLGIGRSTLYRKVRELGLDVRGSGTDD
jgi:DNA-binding NtrC family response regulator